MMLVVICKKHRQREMSSSTLWLSGLLIQTAIMCTALLPCLHNKRLPRHVAAKGAYA